jgi:hypothetical protein
MALLRNAGSIVQLEVEYDLNGPLLQKQNTSAIRRKCTEIVLERDNGPFRADGDLLGLTLRGGAYGPDPSKSRPITVTAIRLGSSAHREGRLRTGDRLLAINGIDVGSMTLSATQNLLRRAEGQRIYLTVEYDVSMLGEQVSSLLILSTPFTDNLRKTNRPVLLEVEKVPGVDFGLMLGLRWTPPYTPTLNQRKTPNSLRFPTDSLKDSIASRRCSVFVERVLSASVADRCGAFRPGDQLKAIDGISLDFASGLKEVYQLLKSQCTILRLEMVPFDQRRVRSTERVLDVNNYQPARGNVSNGEYYGSFGCSISPSSMGTRTSLSII